MNSVPDALPPRWPLPPEEVHVWVIPLDPTLDPSQREEAALSAVERARADRFLSVRHRTAFVQAHGALREILAGYLGGAPEELRLSEGQNGKPGLAKPAHGWLQFNLTHTRGCALVAVARERAVGIDIEHMERVANQAGVAGHFFSPAEQAAWAALPEAERAAGFFRLWTAKEAYVKARGDGLVHPSTRYTMSLGPENEGALLADELSPEAPRHWRVQAIKLDGGYVASLALAGEAGPRIIVKTWPAA